MSEFECRYLTISKHDNDAPDLNSTGVSFALAKLRDREEKEAAKLENEKREEPK